MNNTTINIVSMDASIFSRSLAFEALYGKVFKSQDDAVEALSDSGVEDDYEFNSDDIQLYEVQEFTTELNDDSVDTENTWFFPVLIEC